MVKQNIKIFVESSGFQTLYNSELWQDLGSGSLSDFINQNEELNQIISQYSPFWRTFKRIFEKEFGDR